MSEPRYVQGPRLNGTTGRILDPKWVNSEFASVEAVILPSKAPLPTTQKEDK